MSNVMGGGGGRRGFKHTLGHLGPAVQGWLSNMNACPYQYSEDNLELLDECVRAMLDHVGEAEVERERDDHLVQLFKDKAAAPALVWTVQTCWKLPKVTCRRIGLP